MQIDMKYFNVYYFCQLANESMGKFEYLSKNAEFFEPLHIVDEFPKVSILREYCFWLVDSVFDEHVRYMDEKNDNAYFDPIFWLNQAISKYKNIELVIDEKIFENTIDYYDKYDVYIDYIDKIQANLYETIIYSVAIEMEYILFQNRDFLLRFNEQMASSFDLKVRKRGYIPKWVKRAVIFRDNGCCVFCKKDLTGLYTMLEDDERHFDHIVAISNGGLDDVCNIQLSCKMCNLSKSDNNSTSSSYQSPY
ncbi:HNH endonuclease [Breznakia blatticola]|uniref:HNH endonuclease n=1 Tax=Breznakia blatticola TaxID=1754012 RepID=A0A4R8A5P0_9FIRM|nr:HNH endonuclease signature motif containing protein [Breznakia blatticola]TDW25061.1 HNH endonuclease [Breznakia blatticola]